MPVPTFIVIGAAKCGTTSVCDLIAGHPDVFKEPHYFSRLVTFDRKREWYRSLFEGAEGFRARGEGSTSYTHPHRVEFVAPRIHEAIPACRVIYMVRHPIRRIESDWRMRRYEARSAPSINEAVEEEESFITFGLYWKHLSVYRRFFPDEQILVVFLEDLARQPIQELERVLTHIGVDPDFEPEEPERPRNAALGFRRDGLIASAVRSMPMLESLGRALPDPVRRSARRLLTREFRPVVAWDPEILDAARRHFEQDSARLLEHCGKPPGFWDLGSGA